MLLGVVTGTVVASQKEPLMDGLTMLIVRQVGVDNAGSKVLSSTPKPPKSAGEKIPDEGEGGTKIAEYLVGQKII